MARKSSVRARAKTKKAGAKAGRPTIPKLLFAQASPHSIGGMSMFDIRGACRTATSYRISVRYRNLLMRAAQALQDAGFQVLQISAYTINIAAPIATYERAFRTKISRKNRRRSNGQGVVDSRDFLHGPDTPLISA